MEEGIRDVIRDDYSDHLDKFNRNDVRCYSCVTFLSRTVMLSTLGLVTFWALFPLIVIPPLIPNTTS